MLPAMMGCASRKEFAMRHDPAGAAIVIMLRSLKMPGGLVTYLCRPRCSFRPLGVRMPRGFCLPMLSADGAGYRSR